MPSSSPESPAAEAAAANADSVPPADPAADSSGKFLAEAAYIPFFNLALQQNAFPFVQELKLLNRTGHDIKDLQCRISAAPEFVRPINYPVSLIRSEEALVIRGLDSELNYDLLANLSESVKCINLVIEHWKPPQSFSQAKP